MRHSLQKEIASLDEHYEEFNILYQVEPEFIVLENLHKKIATKYRSVEKQQSTIVERLIESRETETDEMSAKKHIGDKVKSDYLKYTEMFVVYQKKCNTEKKLSNDHEKLEAMKSTITKMGLALVYTGQKEGN